MFKSRHLTIGLVILMVLLGLALLRLRKPTADLTAEINHVNQKLDEVQRKNEELSQRADYFKNESYLERQLRLKFNYKRPDEEAVIIYKVQPTDQPVEISSFFSREYNKLSDWIKNLF